VTRPAPPPRRRGAAAPPPSSRAAPTPLSERELDTLQELLDAVPAPLEPLDVSALDGYLCGVLVQPTRVAPARWLAHVIDVDGRPLPRGHDPAPLHALVKRRHAELEAAIGQRRWFDPWVFEVDAVDEDTDTVRAAVLPWVAGIATAFELFPGTMQLAPEATVEPLAMLYQHLDPDDLEDADALLAEIESLEPPADLTEAVEQVVRAVLLLADAAAAGDGGDAR
jgi:uncharacterized protein